MMAVTASFAHEYGSHCRLRSFEMVPKSPEAAGKQHDTDAP